MAVIGYAILKGEPEKWSQRVRGCVVIFSPDGERLQFTLEEPLKERELITAIGGPAEVIPRFNRFEGHDCIAFRSTKSRRSLNRLATEVLRKAGGDEELWGNIAIVTGTQRFLKSQMENSEHDEETLS